MTQPYLDDFAAIGGANGDGAVPPWLADARRAAITRFASLGFPTLKNEDWHFTSVAPIVEGEFRALDRPSGELQRAALVPFTFGRAEWPTVVFVNGRFDAALSTLGTMPRGVRVLELPRALREEPALVERWLGRITGFDDRAFTALNAAFARDGAVLHIAADARPELPIHLLFVSDANAAKGVAHVRTLIVAERFADATVVESYVSPGDARYFNNAVTELSLAEGATVRHIKVQRESERAYHVHTIEARQQRDSHFVSFSFATGGALTRTNIYTTLDGEGAGATLNGLYMVDGEQHVDHQTRIEHAAPNCFSREVYKGILDGASHGVFNGKVYVQPVAQKTDGKQTNNNLLLSERARVDTKPQLEIYADDVKCTHGATVGRLDDLALFYMKSRGIGAEHARRLLTYAFAADVLEMIEAAPVRETLERLTLERFTDADADDDVTAAEDAGNPATGRRAARALAGAGGRARVPNVEP